MFKDKSGKTGGKSSNLFRGEMMICYMCGMVKKSNPKKESGWTAVEVLDDIGASRKIIYFCPTCFQKAMDLP